MTDCSAMEARAARLLERWAAATGEYWQQQDNEPSMGCYGSGYLTWGVQSNWNYAGAMATLAALPATAGNAEWLDRALGSLRYALATHVTGGRPGNDGMLWGNSWISMLGIERAMHGISRMESAFSAADRDALRRVLVSEADWLLSRAASGRASGVAAGLWAGGGRNVPESNIWSGCLLWRVAELYPGEEHASAWKELAHRYLVNGVSVEADAGDPALVAGRPVSEWHVGANFFPHYALDHHGYLNVGYMAICASNAAMLHFDMRQRGLRLPESLYHRQHDMWRVLRRMIFGDGRLARIGGDTRVRYAYCQEYLLPALLFAADRFGDPHALDLAERMLDLFERDAAGGDGTFYGRRLAHMRAGNPHYYTRLESDRACVLAMLLNYLPLVRRPEEPSVSFEDSAAGAWVEEAHGAVMHRSPGRLASFAWRAHGLAQALCLPPGDGSLAEWESNLCPVVRFLGDDGLQPGARRRLLANHITQFEGGFATCGSIMEGVGVTIDEGASCTDQAVTHIAFAAIPDGQTCLCLQYVVAAAGRQGFLAELKNLHLVVPNDIFNGSRRTIRSSSGEFVLASPPERDETLAFPGAWLNVDNRLGVVALRGGAEMLVTRSASRRGGRYQSVFAEEICLCARCGVAPSRPGEVLIDIGFAVLSGATAGVTADVRGGAIEFSQEGLRGVWVKCPNGSQYALVANFGAEARKAEVFMETFELAPGSAVLRGPARSRPGRAGAPGPF